MKSNKIRSAFMSLDDFAINHLFKCNFLHATFMNLTKCQFNRIVINFPFVPVLCAKLKRKVVQVQKMIYFYGVLAFLLPLASGSLEDFQMPKYGKALTRATVEIIEKFYLDKTNMINFYHASVEFDEKSLQTNLDTMNEILQQVQSKVIVQLEGYLDFNPTSHKRVYNIFFVDSYESFWSIFRIMSPFYFEYQGFYLIVLTTYTYQQYEIMASIFEFFWAEYIINVNIIWSAPQNDEEAIMYTYFPYTNFFCGKAVPIQLNQFWFGRWLHLIPSFFPDKVNNMYGCPLTVATVSTGPFMILKEGENGKVLTSGIDGVLLRVLAQSMNFTINLVQLESQGSILENGTTSGDNSVFLKSL